MSSSRASASRSPRRALGCRQARLAPHDRHDASSDMDLIEYGLFAFSSLFVIVDPIAAVPAFLAMTQRDSVAQRLRTARMACLSSWVSNRFAFLGQAIFKLPRDFVRQNRRRHRAVAGRARHAAGATIHRSRNRRRNRSGNEQGRHRHHPSQCRCWPDRLRSRPSCWKPKRGPSCTGGTVGVSCTRRLASYIIQGQRRAPAVESIAEKIISRLMGLLLAALAVQFMLNALRADEGMLGRLTALRRFMLTLIPPDRYSRTLTVHYKEEGTMTLKKSMIAGTSLLACTPMLSPGR